MDRPALIVRYSLDPESDPLMVQEELRRRFGTVADVRVDLDTEDAVRLSVAEVAEGMAHAGMMLSAAVIITRQSRELAAELLKLIEETVRGVRGIRAAMIETATARIKVDEATVEDIEGGIQRSSRTRDLPAFDD